MKLTASQLKKIIAEEIQKANRNKVIKEGTSENPIQITPDYLNRIIKEEYEIFTCEQRLAEARHKARR